MVSSTARVDPDNGNYCQSDSPLSVGMRRVRLVIGRFRERVRAFYYEVIISMHTCPRCNGRLVMSGPSQCQCGNAHSLDPTLTFQKSDCCNARLMKRACHYACTRCGRVTPSRFLFDERVFDASYFSECARESRERKKKKVEEVRRLLAVTRSDELGLCELPELKNVQGLVGDLDQFISGGGQVCLDDFQGEDSFDMHVYWDRILSFVAGGEVMFSTIPSLSDDIRVDRARRFLTLIHLWHEREVRLTQYGNDLLVETL